MRSVAYLSYDYNVVYQTQEGVFQPVKKKERSGLEKRGAAELLTNFEVNGNRLKHFRLVDKASQIKYFNTKFNTKVHQIL